MSAVASLDSHRRVEGHEFPPMNMESDAMFVAETAPEWADGNDCFACTWARRPDLWPRDPLPSLGMPLPASVFERDTLFGDRGSLRANLLLAIDDLVHHAPGFRPLPVLADQPETPLPVLRPALLPEVLVQEEHHSKVRN